MFSSDKYANDTVGICKYLW